MGMKTVVCVQSISWIPIQQTAMLQLLHCSELMITKQLTRELVRTATERTRSSIIVTTRWAGMLPSSETATMYTVLAAL